MPIMMQNPGIPGRSILAEDSPGYVQHRTYVETYDPTLTTFGRQTGEPQRVMRVYNAMGRAMVKGEPVVIEIDGDEETFPKAIVPAAVAAPVTVWPGIATEAAADTTWTYVVVEGYCDALVNGTADVTKDHYLKFAAAGNASLVEDAAAMTADSVAIATATYTTDAIALQKVYLLGDRMIDVD